jgi:hypothetical protein
MTYGPAMFCCTTLGDAIFADWYFVNVISTTAILQHAVVCRVTTCLHRFAALIGSGLLGIGRMAGCGASDRYVSVTSTTMKVTSEGPEASRRCSFISSSGGTASLLIRRQYRMVSPKIKFPLTLHTSLLSFQ